jgi:hypothetical protein
MLSASLLPQMKIPTFAAFRFLVTLGLATTCSGQVIISEFMADNKKTLADVDGEFSDWIEIYNTSATNVNLAGWALTDDPTHAARWLFPSTNLTAKGFLILFASGKNRAVPGAELHTDFSLKASGEYLGLLRPNGTVSTEFAPTFPSQQPDISYGFEQDASTNSLVAPGAPVRFLIPGGPGLGSTWTQAGFNDSSWSSGNFGVGYQTEVPGFAVSNFIASVAVSSLAIAQGVIASPSQQSAVYTENAPVINYLNTGGSSHYASDSTFPGLTIGVDHDDFVVEATGIITIPAAGNYTFGVNSDDGFSLTIGSATMSFPNPRGPGDTLQTFSFPAAGDYSLDLIYYERGGGAEVELFAAPGTLGAWDASFQLVGDTANGGLAIRSAPAGGGGGGGSYASLISTDVQGQMAGVNSTAYLRTSFNVANAGSLQSLTLRMMYDDGFVAYLNGQQVAGRNAAASPQWNSTATASRPNSAAMVFEDINISDHLNALLTGNNVLAIQGLNQSASDADFLISPALVEFEVTNSTPHYFSTPTPGGINAGSFIAFVEDTKFSVDRGFFDVPFSLSITTATAGAAIVYTTNGSTPALTNGVAYTAPLTINQTTVLRAAAFKTGYAPSDVDTETYIFVKDVVRQATNGAAPPGWPTSWGANAVDYGMDPDVENNPLYSAGMTNDLKGIPSYSIVTELGNLFDPASGIYANASQDGIDWERRASIELIHPDGAKGFHVNAGLRIRGGFSRSSSNPKHAFRFFFRQQYGASKLNYAAFAHQGGADTFDGFDLRTFENYSWSFLGDYRFIALRDQFARDTQLAMGQPAERGDFYHLYINGQYWGLYDTCERPEASYGETYLGGSKEDYDVIKINTDAGYTIFATDGNMDAWLRLWQAATNGFASDAEYYKIQGLNVDGTRNPAYENLLDVDNLIDYMLLIFFEGNIDAPISQFGNNGIPNNFYGMRNRTGLYGGFKFFIHDAEHTLLHESSLPSTGELYRDRTGPFPAGDPNSQGTSAFGNSNPQYLFTRLSANAEFRLRVADHVQKHMFNDGVLTTDSCRARFLARSNEVYTAVVAESARWGDAKSATPLTRDNQWVTEMNRVYGAYFGQRPSIVVTQLQAKALFPTTSTAPAFNQFGGNVTNGFQLTMSVPSGTIYYTRDGSDPRVRGDGIAPGALPYSGPLVLNQSVEFKARALNAGVWSALSDASFYIIQNFTNLLVTEIMYHPSAATNQDADTFEFIELKNVASTNLELSGARFTDAISYTFPIGTFIAPGHFVVLASDASAFSNRYPSVRVDGVYSNKLSNSGEKLTLSHLTGAQIFSVTYATRPPWPAAADGTGFSIVPVNPNANPDANNAANWRASTFIGGSPAADDAPSNIATILVNEALTHTDLPQVDSVELYNPNSTNVNLGNWYLTDDRTVPQKFRIPAGTTVAPHGYIVFTENDWNANPGASNNFRLNSHGEDIYLYSGDTNGNLTGFSDGFTFGAAHNGVSFGRYVNSIGEAQYPAQLANSLGATNAGPRIGPVVINEIQYHPAPGGDEFIELKNITNVAVNLYDPSFPTNGWKLNGVGFDFPTGSQIAANGLALLVAGDPAAFRAKYGVPAGVPIFGPYAGSLQGGGETLSLQQPDAPDVDPISGAVFVPYIDIDVVRYNDKLPWPTNADGFGPSLERLNSAAYGNDPINWRASPGSPSPGQENLGNRLPSVYAGQDQSIVATNAPIAVALGGTATDDGLPNPPGILSVSWSQISGPGVVWFNQPNQAATVANFPGMGTYVLRLSANDGATQVSDDVTITISHAVTSTPLTLVAQGSVWKYLDNGSDQGTGWVGPGFADSSWSAGPAPLGYGDANGQWPATTNSYGPQATNKYVTTYYRKSFSAANVGSLSNVIVSVQRDDGVIVYLNGSPIFTNNMPGNVAINYLTFAPNVIGGTDETTFYPQAVSPSRFVNGTNVLAAEIHQANAPSSDIIFDLQLTGETVPANQRPSVTAGANQTLTLPANAALNATVADDGLPSPPGLLSCAWSKVSGPGTVTFANAAVPNTIASFSTNGTYVLQWSASDSALSSTATVTITVNGQLPPLRIDSIQFPDGFSRGAQLGFLAVAGRSYGIEYRNSLAIGSWLTLTNIPAQPMTQPIEVLDPGTTNAGARFYRLRTP